MTVSTTAVLGETPVLGHVGSAHVQDEVAVDQAATLVYGKAAIGVIIRR